MRLKKHIPTVHNHFQTSTSAHIYIFADYTVRRDNGAPPYLLTVFVRQIYLRSDSFRSNKTRLAALERVLCAN